MPFKERLKEIIEDWFHSDLDIQFILKSVRHVGNIEGLSLWREATGYTKKSPTT